MAKIFTFRGKTIEEIKKLNLEEFMKMITSRERRTLKRGMSDRQKKLLEQIKQNPQKFHKTHERDMIIIPEMVDAIIAVHNGKEFVRVDILPEMIGHRLGEFALTRKRLVHSKAGVGATKGSKHVSLK